MFVGRNEGCIEIRIFLSKNYPAITVVDNKEFKSCLIESKFILSWNKEAAIATMINNRFSYETDSTGAEIVVPDMVNEEKDKNYLKELFALNSTNAITSNDNFKNYKTMVMIFHFG